MYIPEFLCGFVTGAILATVLIIAFAVYCGKEKK